MSPVGKEDTKDETEEKEVEESLNTKDEDKEVNISLLEKTYDQEEEKDANI